MARARPPVTPAHEKSSPKIKADPLLDALTKAATGKGKDVEFLRMSDPALASSLGVFVSTRSIAADLATQVGGLPFGRVVEVYGAEATGKTTFVHNVCAEVQKDNGVCAVWDSEEKHSEKYAAALGVKTSDVLMLEPPVKSLEAAIEMTSRTLDGWISLGITGKRRLCIVWDSLAAMPTQVELDDPTTQRPGVAAKEMRRAMRILVQKIARTGTLLLVVNQQYEQIGGPPSPYVRRQTSGGGALRYHATMRIELVRTGTLKDGSGNARGIEGLVKVFKNSMGAPREESYAIVHGVGWHNPWSLLEKLKEHRYITTGGGKHVFSAEGMPRLEWTGSWWGLADALRENPDAYTAMARIYAGI